MSRIYEKGRSMVEMLGVLAIIGVLSVGGIYGYTVAMRSNRTNDIVHAISMFHVLGQVQNNSDGVELDYNSAFNELPNGVESMIYKNHKITAKISDLDDCKMVENKIKTGAEVTVEPCTNNGIIVITYKYGGFGDGDNGGGSGENSPPQNVEQQPSGSCSGNEDAVCYGGKTYGCVDKTWSETSETCG